MATHSPAAFWFSLCSPKAKEKVLEEIGKRQAKRFKTYVQALKDAAGLTNLAPAERLAAYRERDPQTWRLLEKVWPEQKMKQSQDWERLESSSLNKALAAHLTRGNINPAAQS